MAPDNLKDLLLGNQTDAEFEQHIAEFERLAAYIETENADVDVETKPAELPGQMQKIRNDQVMNMAGGYVFQVNDLNRIRRFLILGTEGGTYYATEKELTMDNVKAMCGIIEKGKGPMLLREIIRISLEGRAPKQDPTLFALALCARYKVRDTTRPSIARQVKRKYQGKTLTPEDCENIVKEIEQRTKEALEANAKRQTSAIGYEQQAPQEAYDDYQKALQNMAFHAINKVCRIPTHLFTFVKYCQLISAQTGEKQSKGWGRSMRTAITHWYFNQKPEKLAMLITKYQNRSGFCHRDLFRLCHIRPLMSFPKEHAYWQHHKEYDFILAYVVGDTEEARKRKAVEGEGDAGKKRKIENVKPETDEERKKREERQQAQIQRQMAKLKLIESNKKLISDLKRADAPDAEGTQVATLIWAVEEIKQVTDPHKAADLIRGCGLVREHVPTDLLNSKYVWEALLKDMPMTAMIRNLGKLSSIDMLTDLPDNKKYVERVVGQLTSEEALHQARIHPMNVLLASAVYKSGGGFRGKLRWDTNQKISEALEKAFILSFKNVTPSNKRFCLALDVSGSMCSNVLNSMISCREAAAGMSLVLLKTEPKVETIAFSDELTELEFSQSTTLQQMLDRVNDMNFSSTDCALPMLWAAEKKKEFDVFVIFTDCETWFGEVHPFVALRQYREKMNIPDAKLVVMGMASTNFTIADPSDPGMLDICGFDSAIPELLKEFVLGNI